MSMKKRLLFLKLSTRVNYIYHEFFLNVMPTYLSNGKIIADLRGSVSSDAMGVLNLLYSLSHSKPSYRCLADVNSDVILDDYMKRLSFEEIPPEIVDDVADGLGRLIARKMLGLLNTP